MHKIPPASVKQEEFFIIMSIKSQNSDTIRNFMYCIDNFIEHKVGLSR